MMGKRLIFRRLCRSFPVGHGEGAQQCVPDVHDGADDDETTDEHTTTEEDDEEEDAVVVTKHPKSRERGG